MASDVFGIVGSTVAGIFHVQAVVAEGGFAVVYRAQHAVFRAPVALKCLKIPEHLTDEEQERFERQFQAEAELLFKLSAGIAAVVRPLHVAAVLTPRGRFMPFLALEWLDGETLDAAATRRANAGQAPFSLDELMELLGPVARALESAHHFAGSDGPLSIVHRDVKPENVFIARTMNDRVVKILDFGIAKVKSLAKQVTTGRHAAGGTEERSSFSPAFGAPEQWAPQRFGPTGPWTDVWGLALTMVEVLAGRPILDGDDTSMMGAALDPVRRPTPHNEGVTVGAAVDEVFERALSVNPQARFRHAGEFWEALIAARAADARRKAAPVTAPRRLRTGGEVIVASGGAAPVLHQHAIPQLEETPFAASIELDLDDVPLHSQRTLQVRPEPESGEWASAAGQWSAHPERSVRHSGAPRPAAYSSVPPAVARPERAGSAALPSSRPPGPYGEADIPVGPPIASGVQPRVWSRGSNRPVLGKGLPTEPASLLGRIGPLMVAPGILVAAGVLLTVVNGAYAGVSGQVLALGPVRLAWIAALAVLGGIGLATYRLWDRIA